MSRESDKLFAGARLPTLRECCQGQTNQNWQWERPSPEELTAELPGAELNHLWLWLQFPALRWESAAWPRLSKFSTPSQPDGVRERGGDSRDGWGKKEREKEGVEMGRERRRRGGGGGGEQRRGETGGERTGAETHRRCVLEAARDGQGCEGGVRAPAV